MSNEEINYTYFKKYKSYNSVLLQSCSHNSEDSYSGLLDYEHDVYFTEISFHSTRMQIWIVLYRQPFFKMYNLGEVLNDSKTVWASTANNINSRAKNSYRTEKVFKMWYSYDTLKSAISVTHYTFSRNNDTTAKMYTKICTGLTGNSSD
jgi:hypothetical protein